MDSDSKKFGRGPKELTGAVDLIHHYNLLGHHEFFCKKPLPLSVSDAHYLRNVAGDTEIRKGEGMELDQLLQNSSYVTENNVQIQPFDYDTLMEAFRLTESGSVYLPSAEKGIPTTVGKLSDESKDKERKNKKLKDRDKEKNKEHKKSRHRHKDRSKDKEEEKKKDRSGNNDSSAEHSKKHHSKKRKHAGNEDPSEIQKHKSSKLFQHKSSKIDEMGTPKVVG